MKFINLNSLLFISFLSVSSLIFSADKPEHTVFINDSILNKSNNKIGVQVQFDKFLNMDRPRNQQDLIKHAAQTQVTQSVKYELEPNKEVNIYKEFLNSNPLKDNEYWVPSDLNISSNGLNIYMDLKAGNMGDGLIASKKYVLTVLNNGLKIETENKLK